jgi:hypothetical protein
VNAGGANAPAAATPQPKPEFRNSKDESMTNGEIRMSEKRLTWGFVIGDSNLIRDSNFF